MSLEDTHSGHREAGRQGLWMIPSITMREDWKRQDASRLQTSPYLENRRKYSSSWGKIFTYLLTNCLRSIPKLVKQNENWFCVCYSLEVQDKEKWGETWKSSTSPRMFHKYLAFKCLPLLLTIHYWRCHILLEEGGLLFFLWRVEDFFRLSVWEVGIVWPRSKYLLKEWMKVDLDSLTLNTHNGWSLRSGLLLSWLSHHHGNSLNWQHQHRGFLLEMSFPPS